MKPSHIRVCCANPKCKRFICTVKVYCSTVGKIAEIIDVKCRRCNHLTNFDILGVEVDEEKQREAFWRK